MAGDTDAVVNAAGAAAKAVFATAATLDSPLAGDVQEEITSTVEQAWTIFAAVLQIVDAVRLLTWRLCALWVKWVLLNPRVYYAILIGTASWLIYTGLRYVLNKTWEKDFDGKARATAEDEEEDYDDELNNADSAMTEVRSRASSTADMGNKQSAKAEDMLRQIHVLADLDTECQDFLFSHHKVLSFGPNELVFQQGAPRDAFLVVKSGEVVVEPGLPAQHQSAWRGCEYTLHPGEEVVGLLFLLAGLDADSEATGAAPPEAGRVHCSTAKTGSGGAEVFAIPTAAFSATFDRDPGAMQAMVRRLCVRTSLVTFKTLTTYFGLGQEIITSTTYTSVDSSASELVSLAPRDAFARLLHGGSPPGEEDEHVEELLACATIVECEEGEYALPPQQRAGHLLILLEGELSLCLQWSEDEVEKRPAKKKWGMEPVAGHEVNLGETIGALSILTDQATPLVYQCATKCRFAALPRDAAQKMMEARPRAWCLRLLHFMAARTGSWMHRVDAAFQWVHVEGGQCLYRKGEDSSGFFVVLSGRLVALEEQEKKDGSRDRPHWHVTEVLHRGRLCGELDCLGDVPYSQTVRASRDSEVCRVTPNVLHLISMDFPQAILHFSSLVGRPRATASHASVTRNKATIAVIPADEDVDVQDVCRRLTHALGALGKTLHVSPDADLAGPLGSSTNTARSLERSRLSRLLAALEERCRWLVYEAEPPRDGEVTDWTRRCIRQADHILVVVKFDGSRPGDVPMTPNERCVEDAPPHIERELLLIHTIKDRSQNDDLFGAKTKDTMRPGLRGFVAHRAKLFLDHNKEVALRSTRHYLNTRKWARRWHHVRKSEPGDWSRCARLLVGQAIGLCLGGGGARGNVHAGLMQACHELGIPIDIVTGTSFGSFVGAMYCVAPEQAAFKKLLGDVFGTQFSKMGMLMDINFPRTSYFTGAYINSIVKYAFARRRCEDLLVRFGCTSTDLADFTSRVHWEGPLWRVVRASMSLVGFVPPLPFEGGLLVDGGYSNQYPVEALKENGAGTVICCVCCADFGAVNTTYGDVLAGGLETLRGYFSCCCPRRKGPDPPTQAELQERLMFYVDNTKESRKHADITIYPDISPYGLLDFAKYKEIAGVGYNEAKPKLTAWLESDAPGARQTRTIMEAIEKQQLVSRQGTEKEYGGRKEYGKFRRAAFRAAQQVTSKAQQGVQGAQQVISKVRRKDGAAQKGGAKPGSGQEAIPKARPRRRSLIFQAFRGRASSDT